MKKLGQVVPDDYVPSYGEKDNFVYFICKYAANWPMRSADLAICLTMAGDGLVTGPAYLNRLLEVTVEYVWDHICGEPDDVTPEQLQDHVVPILEDFYANTTPEQRSVTSQEG